MASKCSFSIDILLRHPSQTPKSISEALSIKALASHAVGQKLGKLRAKRTFFCARLQEGDYVSKFPGALRKIARFLTVHSSFWTDFLLGSGEVELILNHTINPAAEERDKNFELYLAPAFLRDLSHRGIGLRVQGWQGKTKAR
jgi:hypothetical protein